MAKTSFLRNPALHLACAMAGWGTIGLFAGNALLSPGSIAFWRCIFGIGILALLCWANRAFQKSTFTWRSVMLTLISGGALVANWVLLFVAFENTTLTTATVAYHAEPFFLVALGALVTQTSISRSQLSWLAIAFVGPMFATAFVNAGGVGLAGSSSIGVLAALGAGLLYAIATLSAKHVVGINPNVMSLMQCTMGAFMLAPFATRLDFTTSGWMWVAAMGVIHTGVHFAIMHASVPKLELPVVAGLAFVNPAVAILIDVVVFGHVPTLLQIAGFSLVVVATLGTTLSWDTTRLRTRGIGSSQRPF